MVLGPAPPPVTMTSVVSLKSVTASEKVTVKSIPSADSPPPFSSVGSSWVEALATVAVGAVAS